jgi:putative glutamine amidotransferase
MPPQRWSGDVDTHQYSVTLVAVSATVEEIRGALRVRLNDSYVHALETAGLTPLIVPPLADNAALGRVLDAVSGLVLTGGEDVDPLHYERAAHPQLGGVNPRRDATEIALARAAHDRKLPVLAICRGVQVLNVALGGTLVQDIPSEVSTIIAHEPDAPRQVRTHDIAVNDPSRLASALGATSVRVNSIHHQALEQVAPELSVVARAPDGVVEAVESSEPAWWAVGVQWHPEELVDDAEAWDRRLFEAFAARCGVRR